MVLRNGVSRRGFLKGAAAVSAGVAALPALQGLGLLGENGRVYAAKNAGYGDLKPARDERDGAERISLPLGFKYRSFSVSRDGEIMSDGNPVPLAHDGMAGWYMGDGTIRLVRNHEDRNGPGNGSIDGDGGYDESAGGGTTTLVVDAQNRELMSHFVSLNGTIVNCAGGPTPWNSWLTCEETNAGAPPWDEQHGYCFDVPVAGNGLVGTGPYRKMGRFSHEAVAVDPAGIVYETEDSGPSSGFYRFIPQGFGNLNDGVLQMLAVTGMANYDTSTGQAVGVPLPVSWVTILDPDPPLVGSEDVYNQGAALGGAAFSRLEGCWYANGAIYFVSTSGGEAGVGQVWEYKINAGTLTLIFESPGADVLDGPDNLTVSPSGAILLCEDGDDEQFLRGVTLDGEVFDFAQNLANIPGDDSEWAGANFVKHGNGNGNMTLFVNRQGSTSGTNNAADGNEGMTFAIWGPWSQGAL